MKEEFSVEKAVFSVVLGFAVVVGGFLLRPSFLLSLWKIFGGGFRLAFVGVRSVYGGSSWRTVGSGSLICLRPELRKSCFRARRWRFGSFPWFAERLLALVSFSFPSLYRLAVL